MKYVSQSEMKSFHKCKRKYFLGYILRLRKRAFQSDARTLGNYVHWGFENMEEGWQAALDEMVGEDLENAPDILIPDIQNQHELARIMLEGLEEWIPTSATMAGYEIVEREKEIAVSFGSYSIMGKIDLLVKLANGSLSILDLKTAADFRLFNLADIDLQFKTYIALLDIILGKEAPRQGTWLVARKVKHTSRAKPPFYDTKTVTYNDATIEAIKRYWDATMLEMLHKIEQWATGKYHRDMLFPPNPSYDCGMCDYRDLCPMLDDGSDWEGFADDIYEESDPNERYGDVKILATAVTVK